MQELAEAYLTGRWLTPEECEALKLGISGNVVNEMNLVIGDLADLASDSPKLRNLFKQLGEDGNQFIEQVAQQAGSAPFMTAWQDFILYYGSRGPSEIDISKPRWVEDPLPVLRVIAEFLNSTERRHRTLHNSLVKERQAAMQKLRNALGAWFIWQVVFAPHRSTVSCHDRSRRHARTSQIHADTSAGGALTHGAVVARE